MPRSSRNNSPLNKKCESLSLCPRSEPVGPLSDQLSGTPGLTAAQVQFADFLGKLIAETWHRQQGRPPSTERAG